MFNGQKNLFSDSNNPNFAPYQQNFNNVPSWQPYQNCQNQSFVQASNQMCENPLEFNLKLDFQRGPPGGVQRDLNGFQVVGNGVQGSGNGVQGIRNACQGISNSVQGISNGIQGISNGVQGIVMGNGVQGNFSGMQGGPTGGTPFNISQYQQPTHQWQPCNQYYSSSNQNGTNLYQNEMSPIMQLEQIRNQMCARPFELKFHMNHFTSTSDLLDSPFQIQQSRGRPDFQNLSGTANDGSNSANQNYKKLVLKNVDNSKVTGAVYDDLEAKSRRSVNFTKSTQFSGSSESQEQEECSKFTDANVQTKSCCKTKGCGNSSDSSDSDESD